MIEVIPHISFYGSLTGVKTSYSAELTGVHQALVALAINPNLKIEIYLDNEGVTKQFSDQVSLTHAQTRKILRTNHFNQWDQIRKEEMSRLFRTLVIWIKGHADHPGNEYSDFLASHHGAKSTIHTNAFNTPQPAFGTLLKALPFCQDTPIETDYRSFIRNFPQYRYSKEVLDQHHYRTINRISRPLSRNIRNIDIDWAPTLSIQHGGLNMSSSYGNIKISENRTYQAKLNNGNLPTMELLHRRKPKLYVNSICKACSTEIESNTHIWNCSKSAETLESIFIENKKDVLTDLTAKLNRIGIPENSTANLKNCLDIFTFFAESPHAQQESTNTLRSLCSNTQQTTEGRTQRSKLEDLVNQTVNTTREQIIHGLVPTSFSRILGVHMLDITNKHPQLKDELKKVASTIRTTITNLVWTLNQECRERIWKQRCAETIAWEESHSIRKKQKHQTDPRQQQTRPKKKQIKNASTDLKRKEKTDQDDTEVTERITEQVKNYLGLRQTDSFHITTRSIKLSKPNILKSRKTLFDSFKTH
jgi:ribonuclease HI